MSLLHTKRSLRSVALLTAVLMLLQLVLSVFVSPFTPAARAAVSELTDQPGGKSKWVVVGSFQGWNNSSTETQMKHMAGEFYQFSHTLEPGNYEFKLVKSGTWDGFSNNGGNFAFDLSEQTKVDYYINDELGQARISLAGVQGLEPYTPALAADKRPRLVGTVQTVFGEADWSPQVAQQFFVDYNFNNTVYKIQRTFPAGSYAAKVTFGPNWDENYGTADGQDVKLVTLDPADVTFTLDYSANPRVLTHNYVPVEGTYDGDIQKDQLKFDSRSITYKKPFGAIPAGGQELTLRIGAKRDDVQTAKVELTSPDGLSSAYDMKRVTSVGDTDYFEATIPAAAFAGKIGVWGYKFILVDGLTKVEYGDDGNRGATGAVTSEGAIPYDLTVYAPSFQTPDWMKHAVVYQIFPDRFFDGNEANNRAKLLDGSRGAVTPEYATTKGGQKLQYMDGGVASEPAQSQVWGEWNAVPENPDRTNAENKPYFPDARTDGAWHNEFYGGDIQGIQQKLNYLKSLGITAVYLNPVAWAASSHKYDATDYNHLDPMFGEPVYNTPGDPTSGLDYVKTREASDLVFQKFAKAARDAGIKVINDGVFNHVGDDSIYFDRYSKFPEIGAYEYWAKVYDLMNATPGLSKEDAETQIRAQFTSQINPMTGVNYKFPEDFMYITWFTVENVKVKNRDDDGLHYKYDAWWGYDSLPVMDSKEPQTSSTEYLPADTMALPGQHEWNSTHYRDHVIGYDLHGKTDDEAAQQMQKVASQRWMWMGSSGWRLDVAPDVSTGTWEKFREAVKSAKGRTNGSGQTIEDPVLIGEEWGVATHYLLGDQFDSVMNYRFRGAIQNYMISGNAMQMHQALESIREDYPKEAWQAMMNLVASHDTVRSITKYDHPGWEEERTAIAPEATAKGMKQQALTAIFQMGYPGAPTIYYGDEVAVTGTKDPDSRRSFPWERVAMNTDGSFKGNGKYEELFSTYQKASHIRNNEDVFRTGELKLAHAKDDVIAYARKNDTKGALLVVNRSEQERAVELDVAGFLPNGLTLKDQLHGTIEGTVAGGKVLLTIPAEAGLMMVSTAQLQTVPTVTDVQATGHDGNVALTWTAVAGAESYQVYRAAIEGGDVTMVGTSTSAMFNDSTVTNGNKYYYAVTAKIGTGESFLSEMASATPAYVIQDVAAPSDVTNAVYAGVGKTTGKITVAVSVYGLTDNTAYAGKEAPGLLTRLAYYKAGTDPAKADETKLRYESDFDRSKIYWASFEPTEAGLYYYYAKASTDNGEHYTHSPTVTVQVYADENDTTPPAAPMLSDFTVESNLANVKWTASDDTAAGYEVYRKSGTDTSYTKLATLAKTATSYVDYAVSNGTAYTYKVAAFDMAYNRSYSDEKSVTPSLVMVDVTLRLHLPSYTPTTDDIFLAGSTNGWNASGTKLHVPSGATSRNVVEYTFKMMAGKTMEYKYTRGSWSTEAFASHSRIPNDTADYGNWAYSSTDTNMKLTITNQGDNKMLVNDYVLRWVDMPMMISIPRISYGEDMTFETTEESIRLKAVVPYGVAFTINDEPIAAGTMDAYGHVDVPSIPLAAGLNTFKLHIEPTAQTLALPWYTDKGRAGQATKTITMKVTRTTGGTPDNGGTPGDGETPGDGDTGGSSGGTGTPTPAPADTSKKRVSEEQLKSSGNKVTIQLGAQEKTVAIPVQAAQAIGTKPLEVVSQGVKLQLPSALLKKLQELAPKGKEAESTIELQAAPVAQEQAAALIGKSEAKAAAGLKLASTVYGFTLSVVDDDGKVTKAERFEEPITLVFDVNAGTDQKLAGVYYIDETGSLEFVQGRWIDGQLHADVYHFSKYAVLEYTKSFTDVKAAHWAAQSIKELAAKHVINGVTSTTFAPEQSVTRAQFAAMLVRALGEDAASAHAQASFADVDSSAWYARAVAKASELGLVSGRDARTFAPNATITREELAAMIVRAYEVKTGKQAVTNGLESKFTDAARISSWAAGYVHAGVQLSLLQGKSEGAFDPQGLATRAESAQVLVNLLNAMTK
ncbi:S-layer homology domain-containing protein [Paenibacillus sp. YYML68]|uniref:S-layer homology domain-containing protein n=1 Tax=Paenibacillus sp. YYML68 TaxID=2909250 RepID=UPI002491893D|nr:S-layer homology domain-containing protein [Paenibacillus sp. YYML68]